MQYNETLDFGEREFNYQVFCFFYSLAYLGKPSQRISATTHLRLMTAVFECILVEQALQLTKDQNARVNQQTYHV